MYVGAPPLSDGSLWCEYPMTLQEAWKEMEDLKDEGLCRRIGVSNFQAKHLDGDN
jgi:diketogulonate reductase-like aldo/keto reductase